MRKALLAGCVVIAAMAGCSSTRSIQVAVPPRVDLAPYRTIGLVEFSTNADKEVAALATQRFLQALHDAQPGTRVIELGPETRLLKSVDRRSWNPAALEAIKQLHGVDAIVTGYIEIKESTPDFKLSTARKAFRVSADVQVTCSARLAETETGATMWTDSSDAATTITHAAFSRSGGGHVGASDPEAAYGSMIEAMAYEMTDDFRVHYVTRRVPKESGDSMAAADGMAQ